MAIGEQALRSEATNRYSQWVAAADRSPRGISNVASTRGAGQDGRWQMVVEVQARVGGSRFARKHCGRATPVLPPPGIRLGSCGRLEGSDGPFGAAPALAPCGVIPSAAAKETPGTPSALSFTSNAKKLQIFRVCSFLALAVKTHLLSFAEKASMCVKNAGDNAPVTPTSPAVMQTTFLVRDGKHETVVEVSLSYTLQPCCDKSPVIETVLSDVNGKVASQLKAGTFLGGD